jgi:NADH:ubiquinone oxidoreductase subunit E
VGETTEDLSLTLDTVGCVGCCGIAPIAVINDKIMGELTEERVDGIIDGINKSVYEKTR